MTIDPLRIRELFIPDEGKVLLDIDLKQADAQVVAWEADDKPLKDLFLRGDDLHTVNAIDIYGQARYEAGWQTLPSGKRRNKWREDYAKNGVHAVNYGVRKRTLSSTLECSESEANIFIESWFAKHPAIREWHRTIDQQLHRNGIIYNAFGFRRVFTDRPDAVLPQALAWVGQSTIAITINKAMKAVRRISELELLLQVHDSLLAQCDIDALPRLAPLILTAMEVPIPFASGTRIIPATIKASPTSWADVEEIDINGQLPASDTSRSASATRLDEVSHPRPVGGDRPHTLATAR